jgi:hypothetical protein
VSTVLIEVASMKLVAVTMIGRSRRIATLRLVIENLRRRCSTKRYCSSVQIAVMPSSAMFTSAGTGVKKTLLAKANSGQCTRYNE